MPIRCGDLCDSHVFGAWRLSNTYTCTNTHACVKGAAAFTHYLPRLFQRATGGYREWLTRRLCMWSRWVSQACKLWEVSALTPPSTHQNRKMCFCIVYAMLSAKSVGTSKKKCRNMSTGQHTQKEGINTNMCIKEKVRQLKIFLFQLQNDIWYLWWCFDRNKQKRARKTRCHILTLRDKNFTYQKLTMILLWHPHYIQAVRQVPRLLRMSCTPGR